MREILFRGKRTDNGEWVEGDIHKNTDFSIAHIHPTGERVRSFEVIPETVGQYTGLVDKNGTKIFEGDIVEVTDDDGNTNRCDCGIGEVSSYAGMWYIAGVVNNSLYDINNVFYIEVIGNIHEHGGAVI